MILQVDFSVSAVGMIHQTESLENSSWMRFYYIQESDVKITAIFETILEAKTTFSGCPGLSGSSLGAQSFCWFCPKAAQLCLKYVIVDFRS